MNKTLSFLKTLVVVLVAVGISFGIAYATQKNQSPKSISEVMKEVVSPKEDESKKVELDKLDLFVRTEPDSEYYKFSPKYVLDGKVSIGEFKGYDRIIGRVAIYNGLGGEVTYVFATKDYKTFVVDPLYDVLAFDLKSKIEVQKTDDGQIVYGTGGLNGEKVTQAGNIPLDFPETIDLDNFILVQTNVLLNREELKNSGSDVVYKKLPQKISGMAAYSVDRKYSSGDYEKTAEQLEYDSIVDKYTAESTNIYLEDSHGVWADYLMVTLEAYEAGSAQAKKDGDDSQPIPSYYLNSVFTKEDLNKEDVYTAYTQLVRHLCGPSGYTNVLENISVQDLDLFTTTKRGLPVYILKDKNHPLYKITYDNRVIDIEADFSELNSGKQKPSFEEYVAKHPIMIVRDPFGRYVAYAEYEYNQIGGCGKPVVYLYPEQATDVTVSFAYPMTLTRDIPKYDGSWKVKAYPDGKLQDLQPEKTTCSLIDSNHKGSEYATQACEAGVYPYLYWAGSVANKYPVTNGGWIVAHRDISSFLDEKLTTIGLNEQEKKDMMEYWVSELQDKNYPYYRMSFFQAQELERFIPMTISPRPQTVIRVFLDWEPLAGNTGDLKPQVLQSIQRHGFTVVEWGGLKR